MWIGIGDEWALFVDMEEMGIIIGVVFVCV